MWHIQYHQACPQQTASHHLNRYIVVFTTYTYILLCNNSHGPFCPPKAWKRNKCTLKFIAVISQQLTPRCNGTSFDIFPSFCTRWHLLHYVDRIFTSFDIFHPWSSLDCASSQTLKWLRNEVLWIFPTWGQESSLSGNPSPSKSLLQKSPTSIPEQRKLLCREAEL